MFASISITEWFKRKNADVSNVGLNIQFVLYDTARPLIYWILIKNSLRFKVLNQELTDSFEAMISLRYTNYITASVQLDIKKVSKLHNKLYDKLKLVNKIYGLTMLFDIMISISFMLVQFSLILQLFVKSTRRQNPWWFYVLPFTDCLVSMNIFGTAGFLNIRYF